MQINTLSAESVVCRSSRVSVRRTASKKERKDWTGLEDMTQKGKGKTRQVERTLSFRRGEENNKAFAEIVVLELQLQYTICWQGRKEYVILCVCVFVLQ